MTAALALIGATVRRDAAVVLSTADLVVEPGEVVGVVGANGAGKTTLLRAALGLAGLAQGRAELAGRNVTELSDSERAARVAYLPQERRVGWNLPAWRIVSLGAPGASPKDARVVALQSLRRVGLAGLENRGILARSPLLVADEPASGLDPDAQLLAMDLFREEAARGAGVLLTLHDLSLAARFCDRVVVMARGCVLADGAPRSSLNVDVLAAAFGLDGDLTETAVGPVLTARRRRLH